MSNQDRWVLALQKDFRDVADLEFRARDMVDRMALAMQAAQLVQHAPSFVADAFCASRLASSGQPQVRHPAARRRANSECFRFGDCRNKSPR